MLKLTLTHKRATVTLDDEVLVEVTDATGGYDIGTAAATLAQAELARHAWERSHVAEAAMATAMVQMATAREVDCG